MTNGKFIGYFRVSTTSQERSGLGEDAQRAAVAGYLNGGSWTLLAEYRETESGKNNDRSELAKAMEHCRMTGATLLIAKLDRLSRDAGFLMNLDKSGIQFVCADMPNANRLTVGIMALVAQQEREAISQRTKDALASAKIRRANAGEKPLGGFRGGPKVDGRLGVQACQAKALAFQASARPLVTDLRSKGLSLRAIADELDAKSIRTPRGGAWTPKAVMKVLAA